MPNPRNRYSRTLDKQDEFLFRKYGHGLYAYCYVLAHMIGDSDPHYYIAPKYRAPLLQKGRAVQYKQIRIRIKRKENLKKHIIKVFIKDLKVWGLFKEGITTEAEIEYVKSLYPEINSALQTIDKEIDFDKTLLKEKSLWRRRGHPTDTRNKVAFVFAHIVKKVSGEPDWKAINLLLIWLWKRIKKADYHHELALICPVFNPETLRSAYFKFIKNPEKKSYIEHQAAYFFSPRLANFGTRIEFGKHYITMNTIDGGDIESQYPTIVFLNREILKGRFNLTEAAAFLKVRPPFLRKMCDKGFISYTKFADKKEITFSRGQLLEWQKNIDKTSSYSNNKKRVP